jgi:two-component system alkaline phosphatase synthesis response regulator PhoP
MEKIQRILIVEDDQSCAELLQYVLQRAGFQVDIAEDGIKAQKLISSTFDPPSLVILGLILPYIDGYQLLQQIRKSAGWSKLPVIVLSSKTQERDIVRAFELGASDYVTKPFQLGELVARIHCRIAQS